MPYSEKWKTWYVKFDTRTCLKCRNKSGKIYSVDEYVYPQPPIHYNCRCYIDKLMALMAGKATTIGKNGADWWLKHYNQLPNYYISISDAEKLGYKSYLGNLNEVAPGKMIVKGFYQNRNKHLPDSPGRFWYEADLNYSNGYRNDERILFSNDGLIFVTYDHYLTFYEII